MYYRRFGTEVMSAQMPRISVGERRYKAPVVFYVWAATVALSRYPKHHNKPLRVRLLHGGTCNRSAVIRDLYCWQVTDKYRRNTKNTIISNPCLLCLRVLTIQCTYNINPCIVIRNALFHSIYLDQSGRGLRQITYSFIPSVIHSLTDKFIISLFN